MRPAPIPYNQDIANRYLEYIANGDTYAEACKREGMPARMTMHNWRKLNPAFNRKVTQARQKWKDKVRRDGQREFERMIAEEKAKQNPEKALENEETFFDDRPEEFSRASTLPKKTIYDIIIHGLIEGKTMNEICEQDNMPSQTTIYKWTMHDEEFKKRYNEAREIQAHRLVDETVNIADDATKDYIDTGKGLKLHQEAVLRSKLRIETRFKKAEKIAPKTYGNKVHQILSDPNDQAIDFSGGGNRMMEAARRIAWMLDKAVENQISENKEDILIDAEVKDGEIEI